MLFETPVKTHSLFLAEPFKAVPRNAYEHLLTPCNMQFGSPAVTPFDCRLAADCIKLILRLAGRPERTVRPDSGVAIKLLFADFTLAVQMLCLVEGALRTHQLGKAKLFEGDLPVIQGRHSIALQCVCTHRSPIAMMYWVMNAKTRFEFFM
jgi:hypothetical protein